MYISIIVFTLAHFRGYYKAFVYALTHGSYKNRKFVQNSAKKILSGLGGGKLAVHFIKEFRNLLSTQKVSR